MSIEAARDRAIRYHALGNDQRAIEAWRDVLSETPDDADAHARLAGSLLAVGRLKGAGAEAREALRLDALSVAAMLVLAVKAVLDNKPKKALAQLDEMLAIAPDWVEALVVRAWALRVYGRHTEAAEAIDDALARAPDDDAALVEYGRQAQARRDFATVEQVARTLLTRNPEHVGGLTLMGYARLNAGARDDALDAAVSALTIDPVDHEALTLMATVKVTGNPLAGVYWVILRVLAELSETKRWCLGGGIYLAYLMTLSTMEWLGAPEVVIWGFVIVYLIFSLGLIATQRVIEWQVRRESRRVRLGPDF